MFHLMDERLADKLTKVANVTAQLKRQQLMFMSQAVMSLSFSSMSRSRKYVFFISQRTAPLSIARNVKQTSVFILWFGPYNKSYSPKLMNSYFLTHV